MDVIEVMTPSGHLSIINKIKQSIGLIRNTMHKKTHLKFELVLELALLKFTYITVQTKIAKARPLKVKCPTDSSFQKQWFMHYLIFFIFGLILGYALNSWSLHFLSKIRIWTQIDTTKQEILNRSVSCSHFGVGIL